MHLLPKEIPCSLAFCISISFNNYFLALQWASNFFSQKMSLEPWFPCLFSKLLLPLFPFSSKLCLGLPVTAPNSWSCYWFHGLLISRSNLWNQSMNPWIHEPAMAWPRAEIDRKKEAGSGSRLKHRVHLYSYLGQVCLKMHFAEL